MKYLLDANTCIRLLNSGDEAVTRRYTACQPSDIVLCSVVKAELLYGARRSARVEFNLKRLEYFAAPLQSLPFDDRCAHDLILVTHNTGEFSRVVGLRIEDWESAR